MIRQSLILQEDNFGSILTWVIVSRLALGLRGMSSQQNWVLFRLDTKFVKEGVMPNLLHIIPVCNNAMLNGMLESQDTTLRLSLLTNIIIILAHANLQFNKWKNFFNQKGTIN